jgi:hypothetical protein
VEQVVGEGRVAIKRSQFSGAETFCLRSESAYFQTDRLGDGVQHLFSGGVAGSVEEVVDFVPALSEALRRSGIEHSVEVYDDQQLVPRIPP